MLQESGGRAHIAPIGPQAELLMRRLEELERLLAVQEWWMLGRTLPEAQALAEVVSLIAVARAELDEFLSQFCGIATAASPAAAGDEGATPPQSNTPDALLAQRASAAQVLRVLAAALPPTTTFARALRPSAERNALPPAALDLLGIVSDRLADAQETLQGLRL